MRSKLLTLSTICCLVLLSTGCATTSSSAVEPEVQNTKKLTLGVVQKEIKPGMSQADVAEVLGSPNIVTSESTGK